jgi:predicted nucleic acid-binding protein
VSILDRDRFEHAHIHSPLQLIDLYLLALAVAHRGRFVTFDQHIPLSAVRGATRKHLVTL